MEVNIDNFREYVSPEVYNEFIRALDAVAYAEPMPRKNPPQFLIHSFCWGSAPQGHNYWSAIYWRLQDEQVHTR